MPCFFILLTHRQFLSVLLTCVRLILGKLSVSGPLFPGEQFCTSGLVSVVVEVFKNSYVDANLSIIPAEYIYLHMCLYVHTCPIPVHIHKKKKRKEERREGRREKERKKKEWEGKD